MLGSLYLVFLDLVLPHRLFGNLFLNCFSVRYPVRLEGFGALAPYHQFVEGVRFTDLFHESSLEMSSARCFLSGIYCIVGSVLSLFHPSSKVFFFWFREHVCCSPAKVSRDGSFIRWLSLRKLCGLPASVSQSCIPSS
ncbi:unnamed protein product [Brassica napus]|uniref:(rape) hypothetical protein n=1 Tax=Brassica napus TaxID=3708 RepID=A0A816KH61_BRANA|nr:unnamed protein product [Brassica napus]